MEVKDIIRNRRLEMGLTMKQVADAVGVSEGTISRWESGEIENMRRNNIVAISKLLSINPSVIMECLFTSIWKKWISEASKKKGS